MKKLTIVLWALLGLMFVEANAAVDKPSYRLAGEVIEENTGQPLPGATIYIPDLKKGAVADEDGSYEIKNLPQGKYLVEVRYAGFSTVSADIEIQQNSRKDWALSPEIIEGQQVVITGVSKATSIKRNPGHISVIGHEALQQKTADNIIGKIKDLPGVSAVTTGPNVMKPVIRGLSSNRVVVVSNGIRQEGQQWGAEHGVEVDAYSAGTIDIIRGAASLMYGSDALGGVVNILPPQNAPEGKIEGNIIGNYQSNNGLFAAHAHIKGNQNGLVWQAYGTGEQAHDYKNKYDGYVFNTKFKEIDFGGSIGLDKSWGYSHLTFSNYDLHLGLPEGERDSLTGKFLKEIAVNGEEKERIATNSDFKSYSPFIGRQRVQHKKLVWDNKLYLGQNNLIVTVGVQQNRRREYEDILEPKQPGLDLKLNTLNYNLHYSLHEMKGWNMTFGDSGMWQNNENLGNEFLIPNYHLLDVGAYGIFQKDIHSFHLTGGLRADWRNIHAQRLLQDGKPLFEGFNNTFSDVSGSFGAAYDVTPRLVLKANVSRGFRAPSMIELSANGVHEGTVQYERGNEHLKPENSLEFDAGVAFDSRHVSASLYGYLNNINHYIYSRKLLSYKGTDSVTVSGGKEYVNFRFQQDKARLYGIEASVDIHPHPLDWLHFKNTFSYVRGLRVNAVDSLKNLPEIPAAVWISELGFHHLLSKSKIFKGLFLNLKMESTFRQNKFMQAYHTETVTPAYALFDIEAGTDIINAKGHVLFKVFISAENVTNVAYQEHLNRLKYLPVNRVTGRQGIYNMGRNFSFKIVIPFSLK